jgi:Xaa-Pro dipeptidase
MIAASPNVFYFSEYEGAGALLHCDDNTYLMAPVLDSYRAQRVKGVEVVIFNPYHSGSYQTMKEALEKLVKGKKLAIDMEWMQVPQYKSLKSSFELVDVSSKISTMRAVKEPDEIERIEAAWRATSSAMARAAQVLTPGVSELQVASEIDGAMRKNGANDYAFPSIVAFGPNSAFPHSEPGERTLSLEDPVVVDIGAKVKGYCFDSTRTFNVRGEVKKIYQSVLQAQMEAIDMVRPGVKASEVDKRARSVLEREGLGHLFVHSTGHGVGVEIHEAPPISPSSDTELVKGMVITVEPGAYLNGRFGVRIEDTIIVDDNPKVLSTYGKEQG